MVSKAKHSPVRAYRQIILDSGAAYTNRIMVATPTTGNVRMEWVAGRYGQIIPTNWSMVMMVQWMSSFIPLKYQVADAQNLIVKEALERDFEWLLFIEHDTIPPPDAFVRFNQYMAEEKTPIVSGLYYTRSMPSEPILYRGRGTGPYYDWQNGDKVWVDGVPTGMLLVHMGVMRELWNDSPEYKAGENITRRVFNTPREVYFDEAKQQVSTTSGTSDLEWCTRIMEGKYIERAGWKDWCPDPANPFLVDTNIFCRHIDPDGRQYP